MNNINELLKRLDEEEQDLAKKRQGLLHLQPKLEGFKHELSLSFGYAKGGVSIDFDYPGRLQTVELITHLKAGKWDKELSSVEGKMDYTNTTLIPNVTLRVYASDPPPNCKIVETPVEVPAQPARIVMQKKIVCSERGLPAV